MGWAVYYTISEGEAAIVRCVGDGSPLALPEAIEGCPVTSLGPDCFGAGAGASDGLRLVDAAQEAPPAPERTPGNLTRLSLPDGVRTIGARAFARCGQLARLTLPRSLTSLGARAFEQCGVLEHIELPDGVTELEEYVFSQCRKLVRVRLPARLARLERQAFYNCVALEALDLPDTVTFVGSGLFMNCRSLARLSLPLGINLSVLLSDLSNDLDLTVRYPDGAARFFLPGFSYEYEDIIGPRIWRTITHGSGYLYRECFSSRDVDFELYESYFDLAQKQDEPAVAARIAWYRLRWPYHLAPRAREVYLGYLRAHSLSVLELLLGEDDLEGLDTLLALAPPAPEAREEMLLRAERSGNVRFAARLLEGGQARQDSWADKTFDL